MERKPMHVRVREQAAQSPSLQSRINPPEGWRFVRVETTEHKWSQLDDDAELRWREVARKWRLVMDSPLLASMASMQSSCCCSAPSCSLPSRAMSESKSSSLSIFSQTKKEFLL